MVGMDALLTVRQLQELLRVDRITIYRMLKDGRLPGFKLGGQWRFSRQAIEQWLEDKQVSLALGEALSLQEDSLTPSPQALPLSCVEAIQEIVAQVLGLGIVTTAVDGNPLTTLSNSGEFCNLVLDTEAGRQRCINSWQAAAERLDSALRLATCHAHLCYVWGRIEVEGVFIAAIHAGQFLTSPPTDRRWHERLAELSAVTGVEPQQLRRALSKAVVLDQGRQQQLPELLRQMAATLSEIGEERLSLLGRLQRIAEITQL